MKSYENITNRGRKLTLQSFSENIKKLVSLSLSYSSDSYKEERVFLGKLSEVKPIGFFRRKKVSPRAQRSFAAGANEPRFPKNILSSRSSFTLIELLIVIAILVILAVVVILTLNPAELLAQSRDSGRLSDMASLNSAINIYLVDSGGTGSLGNATSVYVSVPDASSTCGDLGLPALPTGYGYHCVASTSTHNTDGTGWLPVKLASTSSGTPLGSLPIDPTNTTSSGLYYTYVTDGAGNYELTMVPESQKYASTAASDGGVDPAMYEAGNKLTLSPFVHGLVGYWPMNEGSGTTANDNSGYGDNGTLTGTALPSWTNTGCLISSNCLSYSGGTSSTSTVLVSSPAADAALNSAQSFSIATWFSTTNASSTWGQIMSIDPNYYGIGIWFWGGGGSVAGMYHNYCNSVYYGATSVSTQTYGDGKWHLAVYTRNYSTGLLSVFIDGNLVISYTVTPTCTWAFTNFNIGARGNSGYYYGGLLSNARVYDRALTKTQIQAIYNAKQ